MPRKEQLTLHRSNTSSSGFGEKALFTYTNWKREKNINLEHEKKIAVYTEKGKELLSSPKSPGEADDGENLLL